MSASAAALLLLLSAAGQAFAADKLPEIGKPAPEFWVTTFDGKDLSLKTLKGQVVVVNFWATWCGPCRQELPLLDAYAKAAKKYGFTIVAVTTENDVPPEKLRPLAKMLSLPLAKRFRGGGYKAPEAVPTNYVIDRSGVMRYAKAGAFTLDGLNALVLPLLKEPAPDDTPAAPLSGDKTAAP